MEDTLTALHVRRTILLHAISLRRKIMTEPIRPSSVEKWSRCPTLWHREDVQGWRRPVSAFSPEMLMGTAVHAGLAEFWRGGLTPVLAAQKALLDGWPTGSEYSIAGISDRLEQVVGQAIIWCGLNMAKADMLLVERPLGADGHTTPDLVTRENGQLVVTDWKYSHEVAAANIHYRLEGPERVHQFQHYIWAVGEYLKEPVRLFRKVVIVGMPKIVIRETTFVPSEAAQTEWLRQATAKWSSMHAMQADQSLLYRREEGCKPYGDKWPCPQWAGCWECHGDQTMMANFYTKEENHVA